MHWWHLYGSGVANKCCSHGKPAGRDVTDGHLLHMIFFSFQNSIDIGAFSIEHLDIVWNPFDKIGRVLVLNCQHLKYPTDKNLNHQQHHLFINFFHWHPSSEDGSHCEVPELYWEKISLLDMIWPLSLLKILLLLEWCWNRWLHILWWRLVSDEKNASL